MREIKFRYIFKNKFTGLTYRLYFTLEQLEHKEIYEKNSIFRSEYYEILSRDQFVDRKDSEGRDIYERDILKWDEKEWGAPYNELVVWDCLRDNDWNQFCEVIGNATENPHLLEE